MNIRILLPVLAASVALPLSSLQSETPPPEQGAKCEQKSSDKKWCPGKMAQKRLEKLTEKLALTPEQVEKISALQKEQGPAVMEILKDTSLTKEEKHEQLKEIRESMDESINEVLDDEQQAKWAEHKEKMKAMREKHGDKPKPAPTN